MIRSSSGAMKRKIDEDIANSVVAKARASSREDSCSICLDAAPSVSLLCCGSVCHCSCLAAWSDNLRGEGKPASCPCCRAEMADKAHAPAAPAPAPAYDDDSTALEEDDGAPFVNDDTSTTEDTDTFEDDEPEQQDVGANVAAAINEDTTVSDDDTDSTQDDDDEAAKKSSSSDSQDSSTSDTEGMIWLESRYATTRELGQIAAGKCIACNNQHANGCANYSCGGCCRRGPVSTCSRHPRA